MTKLGILGAVLAIMGAVLAIVAMFYCSHKNKMDTANIRSACKQACKPYAVLICRRDIVGCDRVDGGVIVQIKDTQ